MPTVTHDCLVLVLYHMYSSMYDGSVWRCTFECRRKLSLQATHLLSILFVWHQLTGSMKCYVWFTVWWTYPGPFRLLYAPHSSLQIHVLGWTWCWMIVMRVAASLRQLPEVYLYAAVGMSVMSQVWFGTSVRPQTKSQHHQYYNITVNFQTWPQIMYPHQRGTGLGAVWLCRLAIAHYRRPSLLLCLIQYHSPKAQLVYEFLLITYLQKKLLSNAGRTFSTDIEKLLKSLAHWKIEHPFGWSPSESTGVKGMQCKYMQLRYILA